VREGDRRRIVEIVQVVRSGNTAISSQVDVRLRGLSATAGDDFGAGPVQVQFSAGETIQAVPITILADDLVEDDEEVRLSFTNFDRNGIAGDRGTANLVILDNSSVEPPPGRVPIYNFSSQSYQVREGDRRRIVEIVQVVRSGNTAISSQVDVRLRGLSATAGDDFGAGPVQVQFSAGETIQAVPITILADDLVEDDEEVRLSFTNFDRNGIAGDRGTANLVILDNSSVEPPPGGVPIYNFTAQRYRIREGDSRRRISEVEIRRTGNLDIGSAVSVNIRGVTRNPATPGADLLAGPIRVRFRPGEEIKRVPIAILGDRTFEPHEVARLTLSNFNQGGRGGPQRWTRLVIVNDDPRPPVGPRCPLGDRLVGDDQDNVLRGGAARDTLIGRGGDDRLVGGACNDRLIGGSGDDILDGGGGNDVLIGGPGNDTLIGGTGKNTFIFEDVLHGVDVIQDFKPGHDRIDLRRLGIRYRDLTIGPSIGLGLNRSTVISVNGNNLAVLRGIDRSEISARRDFLL
ncbi:MAG: M10 family metallopeptidase C-terminal domain-containing protein, partial [Synechococcales cyanobacterium K44_A2020_017]|nr:M10 family metallopeptidase C-terminal domain-containing protein [Synechococcales cyanobacterium K44_A2020_017]